MTDDSHVLINGQPANVVSVTDRGLAYGDGAFETMLCIDGQIPLFHRHLARLGEACAALGIPPVSQDSWQEDVGALTKGAGGSDRCVIKLMVTRGSNGFGYAPPENVQVTRIVQRLACPQSASGDDLLCDVLDTRLGSNRQLAGIKHLNRLEQVLAADELGTRNLDEGLIRNQHGFLIEAVSSNIILVFENRVVTPKLDTAGVKGVMRDLLIEAATGSAHEIIKDYVHHDVVHQADEIILCNSVRGVRRAGRLGEKMLTRRVVYDYLNEIAMAAWEGGASDA